MSLTLPGVRAWADERGGVAGGGLPLPTTSEDFFQRGTQPLNGGDPAPWDDLVSGTQYCITCHANYGPSDAFLAVDPYRTWSSSMMGQAGRDPVFFASLDIANQDAAGTGEYCMRCHVPTAFLSGRATPPDASAMTGPDFEGVTCSFCHRLVDPVEKPGISPVEDGPILAALDANGLIPPEGTNSRFVVDPTDVRRGPFDDIALNVHPVASGDSSPPIIASPYHSSAEFCANCHEVSNPLIVRQPDGTYALDTEGTAHPTGSQFDMFPLHRTFSEWENSYYSTVGINHNGAFGGTLTDPIKSCQDCHMPDVQGFGCNLQGPPFFERLNVPQHSLNGANSWVLRAVRALYPDDNMTGLTAQSVIDAATRTADLLEKASSVQLWQYPSETLNVRVINLTGHKLPTGFSDGRRVWVNVQFLDPQDQLLLEHGAYDDVNADLDAASTTVFEMVLGIDAAQSALTGLPEGPTLHFMLANEILKDNRIPPAGFFNAPAEASQSAPVGTIYANGQNYHDTAFAIPGGTKKAVVAVYHQTTSKEYIEFLRDENLDQSPTSRGQIAYDQWVAQGKSAPILMDLVEITFQHPADVNEDGTVDISDLLDLLAAWGTCPGAPTPCPADVNEDGAVDTTDLLALLAAWGWC